MISFPRFTLSSLALLLCVTPAVLADTLTQVSQIQTVTVHPGVATVTRTLALQLPAGACLAFEDSSNGLRAATAAGIATVVTPNSFTAHHDFSGALRVVPDLQQVPLAQLRLWHRAPVAH